MVGLVCWGVGSLAEPVPESPAMPGEGAGRRAQLLAKVAGEWKVALVDFGGRNNLQHFRDLKLGTLDLTAADMGVVSDLLLGDELGPRGCSVILSSAIRCCGGSAISWGTMTTPVRTSDPPQPSPAEPGGGECSGRCRRIQKVEMRVLFEFIDNRRTCFCAQSLHAASPDSGEYRPDIRGRR
jgi:hypothetical protein